MASNSNNNDSTIDPKNNDGGVEAYQLELEVLGQEVFRQPMEILLRHRWKGASTSYPPYSISSPATITTTARTRTRRSRNRDEANNDAWEKGSYRQKMRLRSQLNDSHKQALRNCLSDICRLLPHNINGLPEGFGNFLCGFPCQKESSSGALWNPMFWVVYGRSVKELADEDAQWWWSINLISWFHFILVV